MINDNLVFSSLVASKVRDMRFDSAIKRLSSKEFAQAVTGITDVVKTIVEGSIKDIESSGDTLEGIMSLGVKQRMAERLVDMVFDQLEQDKK